MRSSSIDQVYQSIGAGYYTARRPDPRIQRLIDSALGDARSIVNVGAGTGNYEPADRRVVAVEPSLAMIAQRKPGSAPVTRAVAEALPFSDQTFEAALATFTLHTLDRFGGGAVGNAPGGEPASDPAVRTVGFLAVLAGRILPRVSIVAFGDTCAKHRRRTSALGRPHRRSRAGAG